MIDLDKLFNPQKIAMIGASGTPGKWGFIILLNILKANYQGTIYPVNPKQASVFGYDCYPTIGDIPDELDLALICTPARSVEALIEECGHKGVPNVIVITSDFSETGPEGAAMEARIVSRAAHYGMRIVGPNSMGIFSSAKRLNALMPPVMPLHGPVSMVSQSGNIGTQMLFWGGAEGVGFNKFVCSGNEGDLECEDYIEYFARDEDSRVVVAYIEGVGLNSRLAAVAGEAARRKPVIVLKGGRTEVGKTAAASHSGSMAGSSDLYNAVFKQSGLVRVDGTQEMLDCAKAFGAYPLPKENRVGILTRGGGWGVITADACEENGLAVPTLPDDLIDKFSQILPRYWSHANPVDMVATITSDAYTDCLDILAEWDGIDAIIALGGGRGMSYEYAPDLDGPPELMSVVNAAMKVFEKRAAEPDAISAHISRLIKKFGKPIIMVHVGTEESHKRDLLEYGVVSLATPERAVRTLKAMNDYGRFLDRVNAERG